MKKKIIPPVIITLLFVASVTSVAYLNSFSKQGIVIDNMQSQTEMLQEETYEIADVALVKKVIRMAHSILMPVLE